LPKQAILDMDPGIDDALAILLALRSPELKLRAITTVSGNVHVDKTSVNALKVLEVAGVSDIPVAKGLSKPLVRQLVTAERFHGVDGLGDTGLPPPKLTLDKRHATDLIIQEVEASEKREITLIATGPLTNIAASLIRSPEISEKVDQLIIMGGAYGVTPYGFGNQTPVAEFNIYVDPEAARIVFGSGIPLTAVGLDVTTNPSAVLESRLYSEICSADTPVAKFISKITRSWIAQWGTITIHDPMAVALCVDRTLFKTDRFHVDVETRGELTVGQTVTDRRFWLEEVYRAKPNVNVCVDVEGKRFLKLFMDRLVRS